MLAYLKLMRISALPTLWSNTLTALLIGFFSMEKTPFPRGVAGWPVFGIFLASTFFYLAGMVLNDYFDANIDAVERPDRVIPSGQISKSAAGLLGLVLMVGGMVGVFVCFRHDENSLILSMAGILIACIIGYDAFFKWIPIVGPIVMGACRYFNIFFVLAVTGYAWPWSDLLPLRFGEWDYGLLYPWLVGVYVAALTVLSSYETASPTIQRLVGFGLSMLIPLDAAVCLVFFGPFAAAAILCLFPSALLLRRIVSMT